MYKPVLKHVSAGNEMVVADATGRLHSKKDGKFTFKPMSAKDATKVSKATRELSKGLGSSQQALRGVYDEMGARNKAKYPRKDLSNLSDAELQRILNRERMEQDYDRYFNTPEETAGQKFVRGVNASIPYITLALMAVGTAASVYATFKKPDDGTKK